MGGFILMCNSGDGAHPPKTNVSGWQIAASPAFPIPQNDNPEKIHFPTAANLRLPTKTTHLCLA